MGGFLGIGGSSAKTDRGNQLAGINAEWNVYNRGLPLHESQAAAADTKTNTGFSSLEQAKRYWQDLLSGDRTKVMAAASPAIRTVQEQADAKRRQEAEMGTSRGGGTAAYNAEAGAKEMADINNIVAGVQPTAAKSVQDIGVAESTIGRQQMAQALQALGLSKEVADEIVESSIKSRPISIQANPLSAVPSILLDRALGALGF